MLLAVGVWGECMVAVTEGEAGKSLSIWGHRKREEEAGRVAERGRGRKMKMQLKMKTTENEHPLL